MKKDRGHFVFLFWSSGTGKNVSFMKASDGDLWVWVMGEHPDDKPYEKICDEIMAERAARQAQKEAEELRLDKMETIGTQIDTVKGIVHNSTRSSVEM